EAKSSFDRFTLSNKLVDLSCLVERVTVDTSELESTEPLFSGSFCLFGGTSQPEVAAGVEPYSFVISPTQEAIDRLTISLAGDVPQRLINPADCGTHANILPPPVMPKEHRSEEHTSELQSL